MKENMTRILMNCIRWIFYELGLSNKYNELLKIQKGDFLFRNFNLMRQIDEIEHIMMSG